MSQAPKEAPSQKYLPSSVYLEEKSDEQKKEEVSLYPPLVFSHWGKGWLFCLGVEKPPLTPILFSCSVP